MGQKVHPIGIRLGYSKDWLSTWYADSSEYGDRLYEDYTIREFLNEKLKAASVSKIKIRRAADNVHVTLCTARPGIIIGKKGEGIETLKKKLSKMISNDNVRIDVEEVRKPEIDAPLVADNIARQLEKRVMFRRAMKRAVQNALKAGAEGVKINVSGRLGGAEIARAEWYREGRVPLHTLKANIDYATAEALTTYGIIGVKVWIYKGDTVFTNDNQVADTATKDRKANKRGNS